jgi:hypothetical protein
MVRRAHHPEQRRGIDKVYICLKNLHKIPVVQPQLRKLGSVPGAVGGKNNTQTPAVVDQPAARRQVPGNEYENSNLRVGQAERIS